MFKSNFELIEVLGKFDRYMSVAIHTKFVSLQGVKQRHCKDAKAAKFGEEFCQGAIIS